MRATRAAGAGSAGTNWTSINLDRLLADPRRTNTRALLYRCRPTIAHLIPRQARVPRTVSLSQSESAAARSAITRTPTIIQMREGGTSIVVEIEIGLHARFTR